jgi:hypothetical protein
MRICHGPMGAMLWAYQIFIMGGITNNMIVGFSLDSKHGVTPQNGHCYRKRDDKPSNSLQQRNYLALKPLYSIEIPT